MTIEDLTKEAECLPRKERGLLVSRLLEGLGQPNYDVSDEEVQLRVAETGDGTVDDISHEELLHRLKSEEKK